MLDDSVVAARVDLMVALTERKMVVLMVAWMDGIVAASKGCREVALKAGLSKVVLMVV